jgi:hypothetical protein
LVEARKQGPGEPDISPAAQVVNSLIYSAFIMHAAFLAALGSFLGLAEVSLSFSKMKEEAAKSDTTLIVCYLVWMACHSAWRIMRWRLRVDLKQVRAENRRKGKRQ